LWNNGNVYIGQHKNNLPTDGKFYELQADGTHTLYEYVKGKRGEEISKGHRLREKTEGSLIQKIAASLFK
jgi:hypothetical protein